MLFGLQRPSMLLKLGDVMLDLVECSLRNLGSVIGVSLRRLYYKRRLKACGRNLCIDCGVFLVNPRYISLGDNVVIDKHVIMTAGPAGDAARTKRVANPYCEAQLGEIVIGNNCHLGIGTIVQGHGGVSIGDYFTTSSHCKIYSLSNDPQRCLTGTVGGAANDVYYVQSPVKIGQNVWLGLQTIVIGNTIGDNVFLKPNSLVVEDISSNSIASGQPARVTVTRFRAGDSKSVD